MRKCCEKMLPILLVAKDEYLSLLQSGQIYLKNCLYYQQLEGDEQRGDKYDSAIPSSLFSFSDVFNQRLTIPSAYIKSFFQYKPENVKMLSETQLALYIPNDSVDSLKEFSKNTEGNALLIWNTNEFVCRLAKKCSELKIRFFFDPVEYMDDIQFANYESTVLPNTGEQSMIFNKRKRYEKQQEFRISVFFDIGNPPDNANRIRLSESIDFSIKGIEDISTIVNLQEIINEPYILVNDLCDRGGNGLCVK